MSLIRIANPNELRASHVVMLALLLVALAGNCLLTSADKPNALPDGAIAWNADSLLLAVVEILDLQYAQPTPNGIAIKALVHGTATALGLLIAVWGMVALSRAPESEMRADTVINVEAIAQSESPTNLFARKQLDPIRTAQALLLAYVLWSFASRAWSSAPQFAGGGSMLLLLQAGWSFALAYGLNRRAAVLGTYFLPAVLFATAALAIAYHGERNPTLRASYPIGNPTFLAACLIPGLLVAMAGAANGASHALAARSARPVVKVLLMLMALAVMGYAFFLTRSRGAQVGLMVGLAVLIFYPAWRRLRIAVVAVVLFGAVWFGSGLWGQRYATSPTGRNASMRVRIYGWDYALELLSTRPALGQGQGGFTLLADDLAVADVERDPLPLSAWLAHAHNEWLEVGSDLGAVGMILVLGSLLLTGYGGWRALPRLASRRQRCSLIALLACLLALMVEETLGVGLRIEGLPLVFYTVVGLIWALACPEPAGLIAALSRHRAWGFIAVVAAAAGGVLLADQAHRDFSAARAQYDARRLLGEGQFAQAQDRIDFAAAHRLSPQRRLTALKQKGIAHLSWAEDLQQRYLNRHKKLEGETTIDPILLQYLTQTRMESESQLDAAQSTLDTLQGIALGARHDGLLESSLHQMRAFYAEIDGDAQRAADERNAAAEALARQIQRQPYDPDLAARFFTLAASATEAAALFETLARPLRMRRPPQAYLEIMGQLATSPAFAQAFVPLLQAAAAKERTDEAGPWAPEKLRLGAIAALTVGDFDHAASLLNRAVQLYDSVTGDVALARATCFAELADAQFMAHPEASQVAIATVERALKEAPRSQAGRLLASLIAQRLVMYHLAIGHKNFARRIVAQNNPAITNQELDAFIASTYVRLAYGVFPTMANQAPELLDNWSAWAVELQPDAPSVWFLAADIALSHQDELDTLRCIRKIIDRGGKPENILELLHRATEVLPESEELKSMLNEAQQQEAQQQPPPQESLTPPATSAPGAN